MKYKLTKKITKKKTIEKKKHTYKNEKKEKDIELSNIRKDFCAAK